MTLYVDSSAWVKRYIEEPGSEACERLMLGDASWVTGRHTLVEVRRALFAGLPANLARTTFHEFENDWNRTLVIELDAAVCSLASEFAVDQRVRSLDALHLAAAWRAGGSALGFLSFDARLARGAQGLGFTVEPA